jgi:hypothetical protein
MMAGGPGQLRTGGTFQLGNAHGELDPPLADHHRLGLHPSEGLGISALGADASDLVERLVQPLPLSRDLAFRRAQFSGGTSHLWCSSVPCLFLPPKDGNV